MAHAMHSAKPQAIGGPEVQVIEVPCNSKARTLAASMAARRCSQTVGQPSNRWSEIGKPAAEWMIALVAVICLAPLFLVLAVVTLVATGRPVIYRRRVMGRHGVEFDAFKFRTMVNGAERVLEQDSRLLEAFTANWKLFDDPRVTRTGRILRKYSLDELPQLFNVLRGEMSLIGPRMISPPELPRYGTLGDKLLSVRPGLTGLWQVSGRQKVDYARRIELDMNYIDQCSPSLDLWILVRTVPVVLGADGAF
jgi:lipopolysaccharide/colanic/teichoic acid biosynthesis glycosyltransferase